MRCGFFILMFCMAATATSAQQIPVRSGGHPGFDRLAFDVQTPLAWTLEQSGGFATLKFDKHAAGFDIANVFSRIDRSRIADVSTTANTITVRFACACTATAFSAGSRMIVMDVAPDAQAAEGDQAVNLPVVPRVGSGPALKFGGTLADVEVTAATDVAPILRVAPRRTFAAPPTVTDRLPVQTQRATRTVRTRPRMPVDLADLSTVDTGDLSITQERLAREIAQAASSGVLQPNRLPNGLPVAGPRPQIDPAVFADAANPLPEAPSPKPDETGAGQIRFSTGMDFAPASLQGLGDQSPFSSGCDAPGRVAIQNWAEDAPMAAQIAAARAPLFGEFDKLDPDAALSLSQLYLHFGFGPEAMRILDLDAALRDANGMLLEMGEILEYGHVRRPRHLRRYLDCDNALALWAILSLRAVPRQDVINVKAALRALSALPVHLRRILAPELGQRLLAYGDTAAAETALRSLERLPEPLDDGSQLVKADIDMAEGDVPKAQERLTEVVESNSAHSAAALIKVVETRIATDQKIDDDTMLLIASYAQELRNDALGPQLDRLRVLALAHTGAYVDAFDLHDEINARARDDSPPPTDALMQLLTRGADDIVFLETIFARDVAQNLQVTETTRKMVADRLFTLGFVAAASVLIEAAPSLAGDVDARTLKAEIALAQGQPSLAEVHLLGVDSPRADLLRARARQAVGKYADASLLFAAADAQNDALTSAFLSDDWQTRVTADAPIVGPLARLSGTDVTPDSARDGMLSRTQSALDESAQARADIRDLLAAPLEAPVGE